MKTTFALARLLTTLVPGHSGKPPDWPFDLYSDQKGDHGMGLGGKPPW